MSIFRRLDILYSRIEAWTSLNQRRVFGRIIIFNMILATVVNLFSADYELDLKDIDTLREILIFFWAGFTVFGTLAWWLYLFWHLARKEFTNKSYKPALLLMLIIGTICFMTGPVIYHIFVIELGKGLMSRES